MSEESIQVAVRVRPFNQRELDRHAKLILRMDGKSTMISDPRSTTDETKQFSFDYSYWSHDGFMELPSGMLEANDSSSVYASQTKVFDDLGRNLLKNVFEGFNCSLFAYGQTGSGKSYSMIGYGVNQGIIPTACNELFRQIETTKSATIRFEVTVSLMEIYNEQVRDLLTKTFPKGGLSVRQHPTSGYFYPQGLRVVPVGNYTDIERRIAEGTANRTIAATNMNATSSRAHTIVTLHFDQIIKKAETETKKSSVINLVDLAGSERQSSSEVSGDRLKESAKINLSLSTLGNVISALVDISSGAKRKIVVPYRESVLTKLLQNALGGNSKTVMIATLSPADINYEETLSTLRFADRVKRIKNVVVINENPIKKLIRELQEENQRLKILMETGSYNFQLDVKPGMTPQDIERIREQMEKEILSQIENNQEILQDSQVSWDAKLKTAQLDGENCATSLISAPSDPTFPYLANLNEDPMLSYILCHYLNTDEITIGGSPDCTVQLNGLNILEDHASIRCIDVNEYQLVPADPSAKVKVNGCNINDAVHLQHKDRLLFGTSHLYVYLNPIDPIESSSDIPATITWEFAQKEIAKAKGYSLGNNLTIEQEEYQQKILSLLPLLLEVNGISEELNKYRSFEIILMPSSLWDGVSAKGSKLMIRMKNLVNQNIWYWDDMKFFNRSYIIKEHYQKFLDGEESILYIAKEDDPFWDPLEDVLIGSANVFLQNLAYLLDFEDEICIVEHRGLEIGRLNITINPCSSSGHILNEEHCIDQPNELLNKPYNFQLAIRHIELYEERFNKGLRIRYKIFNELQFNEIKIVPCNAVYPPIEQTRIVTIPLIDSDWLAFFENGCIIFQVFAVQEDSKSSIDLYRTTTRDLNILEQKQHDINLAIGNHPNTSLPGDSKLKADLTVLQRKYLRLEQKENRIQVLCQKWQETDDYEQFYIQLSAIAFSAGTKLKPTADVANKRQGSAVEIYLFGLEEKEYLNHMKGANAEKEKFWNEYYEKMTSKQRHASLSYRVSINRKINKNRPKNDNTMPSSLTPVSNRTLLLTPEPVPTRGSIRKMRSANSYRNDESRKVSSHNERNSTSCTIQ